MRECTRFFRETVSTAQQKTSQPKAVTSPPRWKQNFVSLDLGLSERPQEKEEFLRLKSSCAKFQAVSRMASVPQRHKRQFDVAVSFRRQFDVGVSFRRQFDVNISFRRQFDVNISFRRQFDVNISFRRFTCTSFSVVNLT